MDMTAELTGRQKNILQSIVNTYIITAEAVGSRTVARRMDFKLSPASVRNVMADLEGMGYVCRPHTSAGRVPTEIGYRLYVNALMQTETIEIEQQRRIAELYRARIKQIEDLLELSTRLLSMSTHYTAVAQTPTVDVETINRVELVPLSSGKLVAILVTNTGDVRKHVAAMPEETTDSEVERLAAFLNERLRSLSFSEAISLLNSYDDSAHLVDGELAGVVREMLEEAVAAEYEREVYLDGVENIFDQPEFQDLDSLRPVLRVLDEKKYLNELLEFCVSEDGMTRICIRIGSENPLDDVKGCSIVASPYRIDGRIRGAIGVIGPTRMRYSRASSLVGFVAEQLGAVLTEMC